MNYEQMYKAALERAKDGKPIDEIFPELKESEEEIIRGAIIDHLKDNNLTEWAAWLEKQGEQKSIEMVEPKFKVGDWIVDDKTPNDVFCVIEVLEEIYKVIDIDGDDYHIPHYKADKQFHLWTIKDAKPDDILFSKGRYFKEYIFMFSSFTEDNVISTHFGYDVFHETFDKKLTRFGREEDFMSITPTTKEQHELLFVKMKEAGYEWDAKKKELNKIKSNSTWSEEDERIYRTIIHDAVESTMALTNTQKRWLKSLKSQNKWKPTPSQLSALEMASNDYALSCEELARLSELYEQLKKL